MDVWRTTNASTSRSLLLGVGQKCATEEDRLAWLSVHGIWKNSRRHWGTWRSWTYVARRRGRATATLWFEWIQRVVEYVQAKLWILLRETGINRHSFVSILFRWQNCAESIRCWYPPYRVSVIALRCWAHVGSNLYLFRFGFSCAKKLYLSDLPTVSVVVPFFNEHWSTLLRTCYSVLNRSPPELIVEIILVDDCSTKTFLKEKLDRYVAEHLPKVKIVRLPERSGLIVARLAGAQKAHGDVLVFLDSHTETNTNWLPPLLGKFSVVDDAGATQVKRFQFLLSNRANCWKL